MAYHEHRVRPIFGAFINNHEYVVDAYPYVIEEAIIRNPNEYNDLNWAITDTQPIRFENHGFAQKIPNTLQPGTLLTWYTNTDLYGRWPYMLLGEDFYPRDFPKFREDHSIKVLHYQQVEEWTEVAVGTSWAKGWEVILLMPSKYVQMEVSHLLHSVADTSQPWVCFVRPFVQYEFESPAFGASCTKDQSHKRGGKVSGNDAPGYHVLSLATQPTLVRGLPNPVVAGWTVHYLTDLQKAAVQSPFAEDVYAVTSQDAAPDWMIEMVEYSRFLTYSWLDDHPTSSGDIIPLNDTTSSFIDPPSFVINSFDDASWWTGVIDTDTSQNIYQIRGTTDDLHWLMKGSSTLMVPESVP